MCGGGRVQIYCTGAANVESYDGECVARLPIAGGVTHSIKAIKLIRFARHNDSTCPVAWLEKYLQLQGSDVGPLFVRASQPVMGEDQL